jgi:hypothetical protein
MLYWFGMTSIALICPAIMVVGGLAWRSHRPGKINQWAGVRTELSMKNQDTWDYANKALGDDWPVWGAWSAVGSVFIMLATIRTGEMVVMWTMLGLMCVQTALMIVWTVVLHRRMLKVFDKNGKRRSSAT